jgi:hypothetical protein
MNTAPSLHPKPDRTEARPIWLHRANGSDTDAGTTRVSPLVPVQAVLVVLNEVDILTQVPLEFNYTEVAAP